MEKVQLTICCDYQYECLQLTYVQKLFDQFLFFIFFWFWKVELNLRYQTSLSLRAQENQ